MSTYCVTFRIADRPANGKSYAERRTLLLENAHAGSDGFWDEPTSFILVGSNKDTHSFAAQVTKGLSAQHDLVFIFDPDDMSSVCFGNCEHLDVLKSFFPLLKKEP